MSFPDTPFGDDLQVQLFNNASSEINTTVTTEIQKWLCSCPAITTFRVNTLKSEPDGVLEIIRQHVPNDVGIEKFPNCDDIIIIKHSKVNVNFNIYDKEVIIDGICGAAVLRGAHIYAPGVLGLMRSLKTNDHVSIYVDLDLKCKKGFAQKYMGRKVFIGNGLVHLERHQLFCQNPVKGLAVEILETISNCPSILGGNNSILSNLAILQNLPSIICVLVLAPKPNEIILDMCASPGNKTTHIAALMKNQGRLVAVDKTPTKVARLQKRCADFGATVEIIQNDATKLFDRFSRNFFDRILLDAPCSSLGKRPQFTNPITTKVLQSYVPLQRKLFETAIGLLKIGGILVYSTCTITTGENEGIVSWVLKNFPLELEEATPIFAGPGLKVSGLEVSELKKLQRFGPNQSIDSIGFFIAKFVKKS